MKKIYTLIFLCYFCKIEAQSEYSLVNNLANFHPFYQTQSLFLSQEHIPQQLGYANFTTYAGKNNNNHPFMPKNFCGFNLNSSGFKSLNKIHLHGSINFKEQYNNAELGKNTFQTEYLSPNFISDTLQKNWKWQYITAKTLISNNITNKINTEFGVQYTAQHKVNYQLPKPLLYKNMVAIRPSLGYLINDRHKISLKYVYKNSNTDISVDDGAITQVQIFSITGVGNLANSNGFASNYRHETERSNKISVQGISKINNNKELLYRISAEKMNLKGYDDNLKQIQIFDYNEWITKAKAQLKLNLNAHFFIVNYKFSYQNGKGTHQQPRVNTTFTEKLWQRLQLRLYQYEKQQIFGFSVAQTHQREANTIFANFYDFDFIRFAGSYQKTFQAKKTDVILFAEFGYQTPTYKKNRIVKTNAFITNFVLPFTEFYHQNFFAISLKPMVSFSVKSLKNKMNLGINSQFVITNDINYYNNLFFKIIF